MKVLVFDDMSQVTEEAVKRLLPLVSPQRREQALRYKHLLGQFCCLKSWLMVEETIGNCEWEYNEYGKPYVTGAPYFSISHCKEGIAVAVDNQPVGIDIEGIRHADETLVERTMNEEERDRVESQKSKEESRKSKVESRKSKVERERDRMFTRLWTQKEAILKCKGTGIDGFESLQNAITDFKGEVETIEREEYIYSIARLIEN